MPGPREIIAALITTPVGENFRHGDAAARAEVPNSRYNGRQDVLRPHRRADADVRRLVSQGRRIGAELPVRCKFTAFGGSRTCAHAVSLVHSRLRRARGEPRTGHLSQHQGGEFAA